MLVYRDERLRVAGAAHVARVAEAVSGSSSDPRAVLRSLLLASELESAVADAGEDAGAAQALTDALARALLFDGSPAEAQAALARLRAPATLTLKRPEGYAY